jgi:hypothetical protein
MLYIFFKSHPIYDQTQGSSVVFLTLQIILLYIFNDQTLQSHMNSCGFLCFDGFLFAMGHLAGLSLKN